VALQSKKDEAAWPVFKVMQIQSPQIRSVMLLCTWFEEVLPLFVFVLQLDHKLVLCIDHRVNMNDVFNLTCLVDSLAHVV
jgi:hypothetical protein